MVLQLRLTGIVHYIKNTVHVSDFNKHIKRKNT